MLEVTNDNQAPDFVGLTFADHLLAGDGPRSALNASDYVEACIAFATGIEDEIAKDIQSAAPLWRSL